MQKKVSLLKIMACHYMYFCFFCLQGRGSCFSLHTALETRKTFMRSKKTDFIRLCEAALKKISSEEKKTVGEPRLLYLFQ